MMKKETTKTNGRMMFRFLNSFLFCRYVSTTKRIDVKQAENPASSEKRQVSASENQNRRKLLNDRLCKALIIKSTDRIGIIIE